MKKLITAYAKLDRSIVLVLIAHFFIQIINTAFMQILLIHMEKSGYVDRISVDFISYRFLGVLLFSVPLGLLIKTRKIKPFFYTASLATPTIALAILFAIHHHLNWLLYGSLFFFGVSLTCIQVSVLPFILRNTNKEVHVAAFSLNFSVVSLAEICSGTIIALLKWIAPSTYSEEFVLKVIACLSFSSVFVLMAANISEVVHKKETTKLALLDFDWTLIGKALLPIILIAIGSGFTIPFVGLFFYKVHHLDSNHFALLSAIATSIVFVVYLYIPVINEKVGNTISIVFFQSFAIVLLILMAGTQLFQNAPSAVYIAGFCFIFRLPFMRMAMPLTIHLTMEYVGKKNRELLSALEAAIWSSSWFISSRIFIIFRAIGMDFVHIFLITAGIYALGVFGYYCLILSHRKRRRLGLLED